ncbi:MAG: hypothetical protein H7Y18_16750 [Clostridiaceae bacterium]|nr:hypothetical protein [Clostridiaceae bacterium]
MVNIFLVVHIFQGICEINSKEKISNNVESQVLNTNIYREKDNVLGFFQENIVGHFTFEGANFKGSTLNLKIIIKDKSEFSNCVKDLEAIKKCNIVYLIAPYVENNVEKFEAALEVKK